MTEHERLTISEILATGFGTIVERELRNCQRYCNEMAHEAPLSGELQSESCASTIESIRAYEAALRLIAKKMKIPDSGLTQCDSVFQKALDQLQSYTPVGRFGPKYHPESSIDEIVKSAEHDERACYYVISKLIDQKVLERVENLIHVTDPHAHRFPETKFSMAFSDAYFFMREKYGSEWADRWLIAATYEDYDDGDAFLEFQSDLIEDAQAGKVSPLSLIENGNWQTLEMETIMKLSGSHNKYWGQMIRDK